MAKKQTKKSYTVERRISVWVESTITADSFDDAVAKAKELPASEFVQTTYEQDSFIDYDFLPGLAVRENW
jgi:hypothetical protein